MHIDTYTNTYTNISAYTHIFMSPNHSWITSLLSGVRLLTLPVQCDPLNLQFYYLPCFLRVLFSYISSTFLALGGGFLGTTLGNDFMGVEVIIAPVGNHL